MSDWYASPPTPSARPHRGLVYSATVRRGGRPGRARVSGGATGAGRRVAPRTAIQSPPSCMITVSALPGAGNLLPLLPSLNARRVGLFDQRQERAEDEVKRRLVGINHLQNRVHRGLRISEHVGGQHLRELLANRFIGRDWCRVLERSRREKVRLERA